jgi:hypothetical protein
MGVTRLNQDATPQRSAQSQMNQFGADLFAFDVHQDEGYEAEKTQIVLDRRDSYVPIGRSVFS